MRNSLKALFENGRKLDLDPRSGEVYQERMQAVLPEIEMTIRANQQRVAELRGTPVSSRRRRDEDRSSD